MICKKCNSDNFFGIFDYTTNIFTPLFEEYCSIICLNKQQNIDNNTDYCYGCYRNSFSLIYQNSKYVRKYSNFCALGCFMTSTNYTPCSYQINKKNTKKCIKCNSEKIYGTMFNDGNFQSYGDTCKLICFQSF